MIVTNEQIEGCVTAQDELFTAYERAKQSTENLQKIDIDNGNEKTSTSNHR